MLSETRAEGPRPSLDVARGGPGHGGALLGSSTRSPGRARTRGARPRRSCPWCIAGVCLATFVFIETKVVRAPLVPFGSVPFASAHRLQPVHVVRRGCHVLDVVLRLAPSPGRPHFSPLITGLGFLPQTAAIAIGAQISSRLVPRYGPRPPLLVGVAMSATGLEWLSWAGPTGTYWGSVFGGATLATFGMGLAITPLAFAATAGVAPTQAGLASGVLNTSRQVGASVALAALATIVADRTQEVLAAVPHPGVHPEFHQAVALSAGFSCGFSVAALIASVGFVAGLFIPRQARLAPRSVEPDRAAVTSVAVAAERER